MGFPEKFRKIRVERGLSQEELARKAGLDAILLSRYERGKTKPGIESLAKIARALEVSADYLVFDNVPRNGLKEVNDVELSERFALADRLSEEDRRTLKNVIDAMAARRDLEEFVAKPRGKKPEVGHPKK